MEHQEHYHANKRKVVNRLARIIGHMEGIKRMVDDEADCCDILIQLSAVRSALNNAGKIVLADHINQCLMQAYQENDLLTIKRLNNAIETYLK